MDYEILLSALEGKSSEFESLFSEAKSFSEEGQSDLSSMNGTELSGLYNNLSQSMERLNNGYNNCNTWLSEYISDLNSLESSLASFSSSNIDTPIEFNGEFIDMFGKKVIPTLKTGGDKEANLDMGSLGVTEINGFRVVDGNIIDVSTPLGKGEKYNLSDDDLALLAYVALREQGSVEGAKLELSLMCNLYERNKNNYSSVKDYVLNSGWFANRSLSQYSYPGDEYVSAAKDVLNDGNRYLASNVVEHDCLSDLTSVSPGSIYDKSSYIPGETVIHNRYGATYVFIGFAPNGGDPFGYVV